jgi:hypothetical protein
LNYDSTDIKKATAVITQATTGPKEFYTRRNSKICQMPKSGNNKSKAGAEPKNWR